MDRSRRLVRLSARLPSADEHGRLGELRVAVVADLVRRVEEHVHGRQVLVAFVGAGQDPAAVEHALDALWVSPPAGVTDRLDAAAELLGGPIDVLVEAANSRAESGTDATGLLSNSPTRIRVGPVTTDGRMARSSPVGTETDALVTRALLLSWPYRHAIHVGDAALELAAAMLRHWRRAVATWAHGPAAVSPAQLVARANASFDELDCPAVLELLTRLEHDPDVTPGAKFETFVHLDRVLALDLVRGLAADEA